MKNILSTFLILLFLLGCSTKDPHHKNKYIKESLITKAEDGDYIAIIELINNYEFPKTKEGLGYFNKWYPMLEKSDSPDKLAIIAKSYYDYNDMFINGEEKALKLLNTASQKGSIEATIYLIEYYTNNYNTKKIVELENKILDKLSLEQLNKLYKIYKKKYRKNDSNRIALLIETKSGKAPFDIELNKTLKIIYKEDSQRTIEKFVKQLIKSNNLENISKSAKLFAKYHKKDEAIKLYEKLLQINPNNKDVYYKLSEIYSKENNKKRVDYLKKAYALKHEEATFKLLTYFSKSKEGIKEYINLKKELEKTPDGEFVLAKYYEKNKQKNKAKHIYEKLANKGHEDSIIQLALDIPPKQSFQPKQFLKAQKWQNYILNSNNSSLKNKFTDILISKYSYKKEFKNIINKLQEEKLNNSNNILEIREFAKKNSLKNPELAIRLYEKAYKAGDVKSGIELSTLYTNKKTSNYILAEKILNELSNKGDVNAAFKLAYLYNYPPYYINKKADTKKALEIYEKLAKKSNQKAIDKLINFHFCLNCKENKYIDEKKGFEYAKKALDLRGNGKDYAVYAWAYSMGKGVEKNLLEAEKYFLIATKKDYTSAFYNLAWLYYKKEGYENKTLLRLDYKKAKHYLEEGEKVGDANCTKLLRIFHKNSSDVEEDIKKAKKKLE